MRWVHELLFPTALLVTVASFWVAADARSLEQRASRPFPPANPAFARQVLETFGCCVYRERPTDSGARAAVAEAP